MNHGDRIEILLKTWWARERGIGTVLSGIITGVSSGAIEIDGHVVLRTPPSKEGAIRCRLCSKPLTEEASKSIGYGPDCMAHVGITNKFVRDLRKALSRDEIQAAERHLKVRLWVPRSQIQGHRQPGESVIEEALTRKREEQTVAPVSAASVVLNMKHEEVSTDPLPLALPMDCEPRPYQWRASRFMVDMKRVACWDDMGVGKTPESIIFAMEATRRLSEINRYGPIAVVCPPVMALTWKRELEKWWQGTRVQVLKGYSAKIDKKATAYILPNSILSSGWEPLRDAHGHPLTKTVKRDDGSTYQRAISDTSRVQVSGTALSVLEQHPLVIIMDEAHAFKGSTTQRTRAAQLFVLPAEYVALLTGTAVLNRPQELIPQLEILDILESEFESRDKFETEYANKQLTWINTKGGGRRKVFQYKPPSQSKLIELHQRLIPYVIRRRTRDVLKDMPPLNLARIVVELANRSEYDDLEQEIADLPPTERLGKLAQLRRMCGIGKVPSMIEWIENFLECEEKLVVFASHRIIQRTLLEHFEKWKPAAILGQSEGGSNVKNQAAMDRFQKDDTCLLAICSTGAAREGITLTAASNLLMTELEWTPGVMAQAYARVHRYGQTADRVTIWTLAADDSMDDTLMEKLVTKRMVTGEILDGKGEILSEEVVRQAVVRDLVLRVARRRKRKKAA